VITARFVNFSGVQPEKEIDEREPVVIEVKGHALFDVKGRDIVCASVSTLTLTSLYSISFHCGDVMEIKEGSGELRAVIDRRELSEETRSDFTVIVQTLIIGLKEIEKNYPEKLKVVFSDM
jgi:uncharacterized protein